MAKEDKVEVLIDYLKSLGFEGKKLEADIRQEYKNELPVFTVRHRVPLDDEIIQYNLNFIHDRMFNAYRLDGYKVIYRAPMVIKHKTFGDIDTQALEEAMKTIDWDAYFSRPQTEQTEMMSNEYAARLEAARKIEEQVDELGEKLEYGAQEIQGLLMFKYWEGEFWEDHAEDLHREAGNTMDFKVTENGIPNATLALNMVSGRFDNLYRKLSRTCLEQHFDVDLKELLSPHLSNDSDGFELTCTVKIDRGIINCRLPVSKREDGFHADTNHVEFISYPHLSYNIYDGISTYELESRIKGVDWGDKCECTVQVGENWDLLTYIENIKDHIDHLRTSGATDWANYLQIRYWSQTFMETFIDNETWKMEGWSRYGLPFKLDEDIGTIVNLLTGHPVHVTALRSFDVGQEGWLILDSRKVTKKGLVQIPLVKGLSGSKLETMLKMLPLDGKVKVGETIEAIMRGERVQLYIKGINGFQSIGVSANPREETIDVYTEDGKGIPINFSLSPDWNPQKAGHEQSLEKKAAPGRGRRM